MHKIKWFIILVLMLGLLSLAGCGGEKKDPEVPKDPVSAEVSIDELFNKSKKIEGMSFDYTMTSEDMAISGKMWMQGDKGKNETAIEGQRIITIFDETSMITYQPDENIAIRFPFSQEEGEGTDTPLNYTEDIDTETITQIETVTYEGVKCRVLIVKEKNTDIESKMWVREDYGFPMRIETTDENGDLAVMEYTNFKFGKLAADTFDLPAGVQIQDMGDMVIPN